MNYFFDNQDLHFRVLIVKDKSELDHAAFYQTHDFFYYKMYFDMLKTILEQESYLVIIERRDTYVLLWTAYPVNRGHTYRKLMKEFEAYKKARTAK